MVFDWQMRSPRPTSELQSDEARMKIAIIGTDGVPARYGGFETFVEQVAPHLTAMGHDVLIIGSGVGRVGAPPQRAGIEVHNLPIMANGSWSVLFDLISAWRVRRVADVILVLGVSGGIFFPLIRWFVRGRRLILNVDGLESKRAKWQGLKRKFLILSERIAVRYADAVISDNRGIAELVERHYGRASAIIAYGADHVQTSVSSQAEQVLADRFGLKKGNYLLTVARVEPENNIQMMIEGFLNSGCPTYAILGNFRSTAYGADIVGKYSNHPRLRLIDAIYEPELLAALRSGCSLYLHGHSVGGSNPALIEMLPYARPILAYDCIFNRSTLRDSGGYFRDAQSLTPVLKAGSWQELVPPAAVRDDPAYQWANIAREYLKVAAAL